MNAMQLKRAYRQLVRASRNLERAHIDNEGDVTEPRIAELMTRLTQLVHDVAALAQTRKGVG